MVIQLKNTLKITLVIAALLVSFGIFIPVLADNGSSIEDMMNDLTMGSMGSGHMSGDHQMMMDGNHMTDDYTDSEYMDCMMNHMSEEDCDEEMLENHRVYFENNELIEENCPHYDEKIHEDCVGWISDN
jgi:hypothetical protein